MYLLLAAVAVSGYAGALEEAQVHAKEVDSLNGWYTMVEEHTTPQDVILIVFSEPHVVHAIRVKYIFEGMLERRNIHFLIYPASKTMEQYRKYVAASSEWTREVKLVFLNTKGLPREVDTIIMLDINQEAAARQALEPLIDFSRLKVRMAGPLAPPVFINYFSR